MGKVRCFDILFSNNKTVYHPGEQVTGQCVLELKGDMKMRALRMFMRGVAKVGIWVMVSELCYIKHAHWPFFYYCQSYVVLILSFILYKLLPIYSCHLIALMEVL
jgi:Arrestin (or S-antigen), N-terminal domain